MVGKIYLSKIYFTDFSSYKIRPVLVIKQLDADSICLQLTSQLREDRIKIENSDLIFGSLKKSSMVVVPKNFTLHNSMLFRHIATINSQKLSDIYEVFCNEIGCS